MRDPFEKADIAVLLPAFMIPLGSVVTKRTGQKEYILTNKVMIYGPNNEHQEIKLASSETLILAPMEANAGAATATLNAINSSTILMWAVSEPDLGQWLEERRIERESK